MLVATTQHVTHSLGEKQYSRTVEPSLLGFRSPLKLNLRLCSQNTRDLKNVFISFCSLATLQHAQVKLGDKLKSG